MLFQFDLQLFSKLLKKSNFQCIMWAKISELLVGYCINLLLRMQNLPFFTWKYSKDMGENMKCMKVQLNIKIPFCGRFAWLLFHINISKCHSIPFHFFFFGIVYFLVCILIKDSEIFQYNISFLFRNIFSFSFRNIHLRPHILTIFLQNYKLNFCNKRPQISSNFSDQQKDDTIL